MISINMPTPEIKSLHSWVEFNAIVKEWISYGDDAYDDAQSEVHEEWVHCEDPVRKRLLEDVLDFMDMLRKHLRY
jgi:hypothetical protein